MSIIRFGNFARKQHDTTQFIKKNDMNIYCKA